MEHATVRVVVLAVEVRLAVAEQPADDRERFFEAADPSVVREPEGVVLSAVPAGAEPDLELFDVTATILSVSPSGKEALVRFGYDLFEGVPTTFAPATDVPSGPSRTLGLLLGLGLGLG